MIDSFPDDLFTDLDLIGDPLDIADVPVDMPPADAVAGPEWYSDAWFAELDPGLPDVSAADLPLPDPFQAAGGVGGAAALGRRFARRGPSDTSSASGAQSVATFVQIADTGASLAQRLAGLRRKQRLSKDDDEA